jgi:hypothetical protein
MGNIPPSFLPPFVVRPPFVTILAPFCYFFFYHKERKARLLSSPHRCPTANFQSILNSNSQPKMDQRKKKERESTLRFARYFFVHFADKAKVDRQAIKKGRKGRDGDHDPVQGAQPTTSKNGHMRDSNNCRIFFIRMGG